MKTDKELLDEIKAKEELKNHGYYQEKCCFCIQRGYLLEQCPTCGGKGYIWKAPMMR